MSSKKTTRVITHHHHHILVIEASRGSPGRQEISKKTKSQRTKEVVCKDFFGLWRDGVSKEGRQMHSHLLDKATA